MSATFHHANHKLSRLKQQNSEDILSGLQLIVALLALAVMFFLR